MSAQQCRATSKASGQQCKRSAIPGGTVCRYHGGAAPQVMSKARERLAALIFPSIAALGEMVSDKTHHSRLGAVNSALDRNGFKPKDTLNIEGDLPVSFTLNLGNPRIPTTGA